MTMMPKPGRESSKSEQVLDRGAGVSVGNYAVSAAMFIDHQTNSGSLGLGVCSGVRPVTESPGCA